jgi:hypothetical protein
MNEQIKQSSIAYPDVNRPKKDLPHFPTWSLVVFLILTFFILKSFIYIKDGNRHGK